MKGLLIKDFYQLIKYCKTFFLVDLVFFAVALFSGENTMFVCFPVMCSGVLPLTLLSYDERCGWSNYSGTLPYNEKQLVSAKYLIGLLVQAAVAAVSVMVLFVKGFVGNEQFLPANLSAIGIMFIVSLVFPAVCLPFCYKFGTEKGRIFYYITVAAIVASSGSLYDIIAKNFGTAEMPGNLLPLLIAGIIVLYAVSWIISIPLLKLAKR